MKRSIYTVLLFLIIFTFSYSSTMTEFQKDLYKNLYEIKLILETEKDISRNILLNDRWFNYLSTFGRELKNLNMSQIQIAIGILYVSSYSEIYNINKKLENLELFIPDRMVIQREIQREDLYRELNNIERESFEILNSNPNIEGAYRLTSNLERLTRLAHLKLSLFSAFPKSSSIYNFGKKIDLKPYKKFHKKYENPFLEDALPVIYIDISKCSQICIQKNVNNFLNEFIEKVLYPKYKKKRNKVK